MASAAMGALATELASGTILKAAGRLGEAAFGPAQKRKLEGLLGESIRMLLEQLTRSEELVEDSDYVSELRVNLTNFFAMKEVADALVSVAVDSEPLPVGRLREIYEGRGYDPGAFPVTFERAMETCALHLARRVREEASAPGNPLHGLVSVSKLYGLEESITEVLRRTEPTGPMAEELERESWARCKRRWRLLGVSAEEAEALAKNPAVGAPGRAVRDILGEPVVVITAEVGSGKSLLLDRLMQRAIARYRETEGARLPVFVRATEVEGKLREAVVAGTSGLGKLSELGAAVFLDGLEEAGQAHARRLLDEAHYLPDQLPNTTVVVAGRPIRELDEERERGQAFVLPPLSEEESLALVRRFAGHVQGAIGHGWSASLAEATRRPLFATLVGLDMRDRYGWDTRSEGELLAHLVDRALSDSEDTADLRELRDLAVAVIESGTGYVRASDAGTAAEVRRLRRTGFVYQQGNLLIFSLQILAEWFGAQALELGEVAAEELASDFARLERWRYPLVMAVSNFGYERVLSIFGPVVRAAPAFASQIADAAFTRFGGAAEGAVEDADVVTRRFRETMGAWVEGLGALAPFFAPVRQYGSLGTLAVTGWEPWEPGKGNYAWYAGEVALPDVVPYSRVIHSELQYGIPQRTYVVRRQAAWPWGTTFNDLRGDLEKALKAQKLMALTPMLEREAAWRAAKELLYREKRRMRSVDRPMDLGELEELLDKLGAWDGHWIWRPPPPDSSVRPALFGARHLVDEVSRLRGDGATEMTSPVPAADLTVEEVKERAVEGEAIYTWDFYSEEVLLERARVLVNEALRAYTKISETLLPTLIAHLPMAATLPGEVTGHLELNRHRKRREPAVRWRVAPLPFGSESHCELSIETEQDEASLDAWKAYDEYAYHARLKIASLRPEAAGWLVPFSGDLSSGQLFDSTPVTKTAYKWLWDDLRYAKWTDRPNPWLT